VSATRAIWSASAGAESSGEMMAVDEAFQLHAPLVPHCAKDTQAQWSSLMEQYAARKSGGRKVKFGRKGR
jgi:hypothetical protein